MNEEINGAIDYLIEIAKNSRSGKISKNAFNKACQEFGVPEMLLDHWFFKRNGQSWKIFQVVTDADIAARQITKSQDIAKKRATGNPERYHFHTKDLCGEIVNNRGEQKIIFVGLVVGGGYEVINTNKMEISECTFEDLEIFSKSFSKVVRECNLRSAPDLARQRVAHRPEFYRYGINKAGLIDGRKRWCYIAMRQDDLHELIFLNDFSICELYWSDIYEISETFVHALQS
jgi:hypothetical protein